MENILSGISIFRMRLFGATYVLMAGETKNNDWKTAQEGDRALRSNYSYKASIRHGIPFDEVCKNQYNQITDGYQRNDASVFQ